MFGKVKPGKTEEELEIAKKGVDDHVVLSSDDENDKKGREEPVIVLSSGEEKEKKGREEPIIVLSSGEENDDIKPNLPPKVKYVRHDIDIKTTQPDLPPPVKDTTFKGMHSSIQVPSSSDDSEDDDENIKRKPRDQVKKRKVKRWTYLLEAESGQYDPLFAMIHVHELHTKAFCTTYYKFAKRNTDKRLFLLLQFETKTTPRTVKVIYGDAILPPRDLRSHTGEYQVNVKKARNRMEVMRWKNMVDEIVSRNQLAMNCSSGIFR